MTATTAQTPILLKNYDEICKSFSGENSGRLEAIRKNGYETYVAQNSLIKKLENWRYSKPRFIDKNEFDHFNKATNNAYDEFGFNIDSYKIYVINGVFSADISNLQDLNNKIKITSLKEAIKDSPAWLLEILGCYAVEKNNPFVALNSAYLNDGLIINIGKNVVLEKPIQIIHLSEGRTPVFYNSRSVVLAQESSEATIFEVFENGHNDLCFSNSVNEISLKKNAILNHYKIQKYNTQSNHISYNAVKTQENSNYESFTIHKGANFSRSELNLILDGEYSSCKCDGAYLNSDNRHSDITVSVKHAKGYTNSDQIVKGVADNSSKSVFQGLIRVDRDSQKIIGNQLHKALLLSSKAEVDCKPELEIYADDVQCSHGATAGELDETQMFYLRTRGLSEEQARNLLIEAFLDDILNRIKISSVREVITDDVKIWLSKRK